MGQNGRSGGFEAVHVNITHIILRNICLSSPSRLRSRRSGPVDPSIGGKRSLKPIKLNFIMSPDDEFIYPSSYYSSMIH